MERAVKKSERHQPHFLRPWNDGWQIWKKDSPDASWVLEEVRDAIAPLPLPKCDWFCAVPARKAISWAGWVLSEDDAVLSESASLLLEVAGYTGPSTAPDARLIVPLKKTGGRTLIRAALMPSDFEVPPNVHWKAFFPSPLALPTVPYSLVLHREGTSLVATLCGEEYVLFWEAHPGIPEKAAARSWIELMLLEADATGILPALEKIIDYTGQLGTEQLFGAPVLSIDESLAKIGPPPAPPADLPQWLPPGVRLHRIAVTQQKKIRRALLAVGALLVILALVATGVILQAKIRIAQVRAEVAQLETATAPLIETARAWDLLADSIEPSRFALEKLLMAVNALPQNGVRLSIFEVTPSGIRIEGDARNVGLATLYFNALREDPAAAHYEWEMPPPALQPDNSARFAINGTPKENEP
jgi:hypothetical protein